MRIVADAIVVPMQIAPVCTRITTLGVCRRGRFAIGVLHLALGHAQCNGGRPIFRPTSMMSGSAIVADPPPPHAVAAPPQPTRHHHNLPADNPVRCGGGRAQELHKRSRFVPEARSRDFAAIGLRASHTS